MQRPGKEKAYRQQGQLSHLLASTLVPLTNPALPSGLWLEVLKGHLTADIPREWTYRLVVMLELRLWKKQGWD